MNLARVEGHSNLYRDLNTNAIINSNSSEYHEYLKNRNIRENNDSKIKNLESKIDDLTDQFSQIKTLLIKLTEDNGIS